MGEEVNVLLVKVLLEKIEQLEQTLQSQDFTLSEAYILRSQLLRLATLCRASYDPEAQQRFEQQWRKEFGQQKRIDDLDFSVRTYNCLKREGIETLADLTECCESELLGIRNFGKKSLNEVKAELQRSDLSLAKKDESHACLLAHLCWLDLPGEIEEQLSRGRLQIWSIRQLIQEREEKLGAFLSKTAVEEIKRKLSAIGLSLQA